MATDPLSLEAYEHNQEFNVINRFLHGGRYKTVIKYMLTVANNRPLRVLDIGCSTGMLYPRIVRNLEVDYTGIDRREELIQAARNRYPDAKFLAGEASDLIYACGQQDVICALETFEHIPELEVANLIPLLIELKPKLFIITVPVEFGPVIWIKNLGSALMGYSRHREYTWLETFWAGFGRWDKLPPHRMGHKGFHWSHLAKTVQQYWDVEIQSSPFKFLPACLNPSVAIIARPREELLDDRSQRALDRIR